MDIKKTEYKQIYKDLKDYYRCDDEALIELLTATYKSYFDLCLYHDPTMLNRIYIPPEKATLDDLIYGYCQYKVMRKRKNRPQELIAGLR